MRQPIEFVDVTQRDGEQMEINPVTIEERIQAFDALVETGIEQFEIGHLGNSGREGFDEGDQAYARALIAHIDNKSGEDHRYKKVRLQVLFGSQQQLIAEGLEALEGFDKGRIIVHVYDRLSPNLRELAAQPYSAETAADRVVEAAKLALDRGFTHFSVSGEGATDCSVDEAVDYHVAVGKQLVALGVTSVNMNLANTFGTPPDEEWDEFGLTHFNNQIKQHIPGATTSVHVHNDDQSATEFSIDAIKAGFDTVEGTLTGMGERTGNVALSNVLIRLVEIARLELESAERPVSAWRIGQAATKASLFTGRLLPQAIVQYAHSWYDSSIRISDIYGAKAQKRFENASLGDPEAYKAGSGPHDHAAIRAIQDPVKYPLWKGYLRIALPHAALGRPEASGIIEADPEVIKRITVNGRAGGGSTQIIVDGSFTAASDERRAEALKAARDAIDTIYDHVA